MACGKRMNDMKELLESKIERNAEEEKRNAIQKYSPELHQFLEGEIKSGKAPLHVAGLAKMASKPFQKIIKQMEKDYKSPWDAIVEAIYGGAEEVDQMEAKRQEALQGFNQKKNLQQRELERLQGAYGQQQPPPGQGQQALMAIMQQINQKLGG